MSTLSTFFENFVHKVVDKQSKVWYYRIVHIVDCK